MKKLIATLMTLIVLSIAAVPAGAQTRDRRTYRRAAQTRYDARYDNGRYATDQYIYEDDRSIGRSIGTKSRPRGVRWVVPSSVA